MSAIAERVQSELAEIVAIRHDLHKHPELMFEEHRTSELVQRELTKAGIEFKAGLAKGTGVLGFLPATTKDPSSASTIALRADMDALPIHEETGKLYGSTIPGKMHACGHDGHTSILIGVARALAKTQDRPNNTLLVFQPAEEGGAGGREMCNDGVLNGSIFPHKAKMIFGLHGWTTVRIGHVATRTGALMAATNTFEVTVKGVGGHAAAPNTTIDPVVVAAHIVTALQTIASRNTDPFDSIVLTVGQFKAGTAENIIPQTAWLNGTIRTMLPDTRAYAEKRFKEIVSSVAEAFGATAEINWHEGYPVTMNDPGATAHFVKVASSVLGPEFVDSNAVPTMGGEDFSYYGYEIPACFFQLGLVPVGQGHYPNVHTPMFDFNDDAIATGIRVFCELALTEV
ncbi:MAG: amidohydrolase [Fimbriimonadaceae bacterium]|nr:amidohydrolase [Fimbriimonadaceae bacterium]